ncbi:MAG: DUF1799 domain-containing protein [Desulfobacterales bacterium]|jgi:hypothetical protein|nr:DUF1799 domain-containing protein [Desulfobacterales bacterium]MCU0601290.1 DUF1799 domain-containing protein [Desulfobacterales bacterium]
MPGNIDAWELWQACRTQWRAAGMGVIGLDYGLVLKLSRLMRIEITPALLGKIQAIEAAALKKMNKVPES